VNALRFPRETGARTPLRRINELTAVTFQEQTNNGNNFAYLYSYNQAGRVTANTLIASNGSTLLTNLQATYAWGNQGRLTNLTYPSGTALAY
jgi:YD repeat-containing protein